MKRFFKNIIFSLIPLLVLFLLLEITLRLTGFQFSQQPLEMRAKLLAKEGATPTFIDFHTKGKMMEFVRDPYQMWVPKDRPFAEGIPVEKGDKVRIVTMGDSCSAGCVAPEVSDGWDREYSTLVTYPGYMQEYLDGVAPGMFEVLNGAVGGHSSYQGYQRLMHTVLPYKPDIVTIYYGWNDHWVAGNRDKNTRVQKESVTRVFNFLEKFRSFQLINYTVSSLRKKTLVEAEKPDVSLRVPIDDYEENLGNMIDIIRENGGHPVLVTAPYDLSHFEPQSFFPYSKEELLPLHQAYNQMVRKMAAEKNVLLIDLAAIVNRVRSESQELKLLGKDGIHFTNEGCRFVAKIISDVLLAKLSASQAQ